MVMEMAQADFCGETHFGAKLVFRDSNFDLDLDIDPDMDLDRLFRGIRLQKNKLLAFKNPWPVQVHVDDQVQVQVQGREG
jgi:hypothetical protein